MTKLIQMLSLAFALAVGAVLLSPTVSPGAQAEEKAKSPPQPKSDPCAGDRMKSACKNSEATRSLLRTQPPPSTKSSTGSNSGGSTGAK
ncbi:MAG: hypothetical protein WD871_07360 [Xanthobacteraceae bacterium]